MRLKTKLSPGITTRPEGNTGEKITKTPLLNQASIGRKIYIF